MKRWHSKVFWKYKHFVSNRDTQNIKVVVVLLPVCVHIYICILTMTLFFPSLQLLQLYASMLFSSDMIFFLFYLLPTWFSITYTSFFISVLTDKIISFCLYLLWLVSKSVSLPHLPFHNSIFSSPLYLLLFFVTFSFPSRVLCWVLLIPPHVAVVTEL